LQAHVPGKVDPGILAYLGYKTVNQGPPQGLGIDRGKMCFRQDFPHHPRRGARVHKIVDDQHAPRINTAHSARKIELQKLVEGINETLILVQLGFVVIEK
jgi:hypothetical protein